MLQRAKGKAAHVRGECEWCKPLMTEREIVHLDTGKDPYELLAEYAREISPRLGADNVLVQLDLVTPMFHEGVNRAGTLAQWAFPIPRGCADALREALIKFCRTWTPDAGKAVRA